MRILLFLCLSVCLAMPIAVAADSDDAPDFGALSPGFVPYSWNDSTGKLYLHFPAELTELLYISSLSSGLGSNDIGLDRGQLGATRVVRIERVGPKLLLVQPNLAYRALTSDAAEQRAVEEGFAQSVVWGFTIEDDVDGHIVVDATDFLLRDAHDVVGALRASEQGDFKLDASRSALNFERTKAFPKNSEFDAMLTFTGDRPGRWVRDVAPDPKSFTVHQHHSFVELPGPGFEERAFDPRMGVFPHVVRDYATPIDRPLERRTIERFRLAKKDPGAQRSEPVTPIVYYLDPGTPEPVRSALLDGARWWDQAFEAAGYINAFQVEMLPPDADPMDVRYNVIQWVHRATRGWSYGASVVDPRTGEIIKGHVTLGSLRVRQDFLIAQGLLGPYTDANSDTSVLTEMSLARLRQLSAHEVGHTLGFAHNFVASADGDTSVMDYPHPKIRLVDGMIHVSTAYDTGIGAWDKATVAYAYQDFPEGADEAAGLRKIAGEALANGFRFISDADARPFGGSHPDAHLWDNGGDAVEELRRVLDVRRVALENFSERNIPVGAPMATLQEALVPVYLLHRYQAEAAAKLVGGVDFSYALRGDGQPGPAPVPAGEQRAALNALLDCLEPEMLRLPAHIAALIHPRPFGYPSHRELFDGHTGATLDELGIAEAAAAPIIQLLLDPARAARLIERHATDSATPDFAVVVDALLQRTAYANLRNRITQDMLISYTLGSLVVDELMRVAANETAAPIVRAVAVDRLKRVADYYGDSSGDRLASEMVDRIGRFRAHPETFEFPPRPSVPPGSPIGMEFCSVAE